MEEEDWEQNIDAKLKLPMITKSSYTVAWRFSCVKCAQEDRISNLPEHLIDSILERLPFEDAVKTSIISQNWRYKWTTMKVLVLDEHFSNKYAKNGAFGRNGFIRVITRILILHE
ncbi:hypothetical protein LXL04_033495 [Taraxacum kok-saghyz]